MFQDGYLRVQPRRPTITISLLIANTLVFLFSSQFLIQEFGFAPKNFFEKPWTLITSMFIHGGFTHFFWNMLALIMFGSFLELRISRKNFLLIYFVAGILGGLAYWITSPFSEIPAVGASGCIYGILGAVAILYPTLMVWVGLIPMPMIIAACFWALVSLVGIFVPSNIAHQAHLAGLIVGFYFGHRIKVSGEYS